MQPSITRRLWQVVAVYGVFIAAGEIWRAL